MKPGDKVTFLNEQGGGTVLRVEGRLIVVKDSDGFERRCDILELSRVRITDFGEVVDRKDFKPKKKEQAFGTDEWSIDLHLEELTDGAVDHLSNTEKLDIQLRRLRSFVEKAMEKKVRKITIVHGVGEGVLRKEVHFFLRSIEGAVFHDSSYTRNGFGATVLELRYRY